MKRTIDTSAITHDGETLTIKQWSQRTGIPAFKIYSRLSLGWSVAEALSGPVVITFNGETLTIPEWSERTGLSELAIKARVREGWTPERTLTYHAKQTTSIQSPVITYEGETLTIPEWSQRTGIAYNVLHSRLGSNWTPERILTEPVKGSGQTITHNGETLTIPEWAKRTGIRINTIRDRLRANWTPEQALTAPVQARTQTTQAHPGVVHDFAAYQGTGGGRLLQETPKISFPSKEQVKP